ncbi:MAG TPA: tetratricopeptide repeat protein, partial [Kofleriaceae bacterium]|nr:tetratricopeptide repeat protein [Kofleriaceae bacterium]
YDLGEADGRYFIAMEYIEGEPLLAVLRAGREGRRLDVLSTGRLISDTAEGLDAAHELRTMAGDPLELVHHDVSLGNIVVLYNGQVKLVDFGVAKATQSADSRARVQGKFSYMAPEKLKGIPGDRRSDIWSLGCVLWEALTLKRLFKGGNDTDTMRQVLESAIPPPSKINGDVLPDFDAIVMKALSRDPATRYATAKAMASDIEEVLRKHGYGGKNDLIAKYMQGTFDDHIAARKKLLQEVSSKGRASADVVEAAFRDENPLHAGEFSVKFRASDVAEGTPVERAIARPAHRHARPITSQPLAPPKAASQRLSLPIPTLEAAVVEGVRVPDPPRRIPFVIGGLVLAVIVGVIITILMRGGDDDAPRQRAVAPRVDIDAAEVAPPPAPPADAAVVVEIDAAEPELDIEVSTDDSDATKPRPKPQRANAPELTKQGLNAMVRGDSKSALALYRQAQRANPSYAPAWRQAGLLYEKMGDRGAAKAAFQRYLILVPSATDAAQIRARIGNL